MIELLGTCFVIMEETGRIRLPQDYIDAFGDVVFLCFGEGPHVRLLPREERDALMKAYRDKPRPLSPEDEWALRELTRSLTEVPVKGKGRVTIPKAYREHGGFKGGEQLMLVGVLRHLELWKSEETYKAAKERQAERQRHAR
jgi:DNA-binding transcriptional regulator/RsmH inhibitor MraZ